MVPPPQDLIVSRLAWPSLSSSPPRAWSTPGPLGLIPIFSSCEVRSCSHLLSPLGPGCVQTPAWRRWTRASRAQGQQLERLR